MVTNTLMRHEAPSDPFLADGDGMVHTTSHLRRWSLTALYRYQVVSAGVIPHSTVLGGTRYIRVWVLAPPRETRVG